MHIHIVSRMLTKLVNQPARWRRLVLFTLLRPELLFGVHDLFLLAICHRYNLISMIINFGFGKR